MENYGYLSDHYSWTNMNNSDCNIKRAQYDWDTTVVKEKDLLPEIIRNLYETLKIIPLEIIMLIETNIYANLLLKPHQLNNMIFSDWDLQAVVS